LDKLKTLIMVNRVAGFWCNEKNGLSEIPLCLFVVSSTQHDIPLLSVDDREAFLPAGTFLAPSLEDRPYAPPAPH
jgi:hypothetical protein